MILSVTSLLELVIFNSSISVSPIGNNLDKEIKIAGTGILLESPISYFDLTFLVTSRTVLSGV